MARRERNQRSFDEPASGRINRRGVGQGTNNAPQSGPARQTGGSYEPPAHKDGYTSPAGYGLAGLEAELYAEEQGGIFEEPEQGKRGKRPKTPKTPKQHRQKAPRSKRHFVRTALLLLLGAVVAAVVALFIALQYSTRNDDLWLNLDQMPYRDGTVLYYTDQQTGEIGVYQVIHTTENKQYVDGGQMPEHLLNAFVAVEDQKFYTHSGVDLKRTIYATVNELAHSLTGNYLGGENGRKQGASTITQQLIKNLTGDDDASGLSGYYRKILEIYRAYKLDAAYTKQEILHAYLNTIRFTGNTAGVQAESLNLFGKDVSELTLAECASLAAITRSPASYNPVTNPEKHLARRNYVLAEMLKNGYISQAEYEGAVAEELHLAEGAGTMRFEEPVYDWFTEAVFDWVRDELVSQRGLTRAQASDLIYRGGLQIYTTVVPELQAAMEQVMESRSYFTGNSHQAQQQVEDEEGNPLYDEAGNPLVQTVTVYPEAAMVSLDYEGGVAAVVGALGEKEVRRGRNNALVAQRQIGSTAKGIGPYVLALEDNKITWSSSFIDQPVRQVVNEATGETEDWPRNVTNYYSGKEVLVTDAFAQSVNTIAVQVGDLVGNNKMYRFLTKEIGISYLPKSDRDTGPLVLGSNTYGITPVDMAKAYSMFGNGGYIYTTHCFTHITNGVGDVLLEVDVQNEQVIGDDTAFIMNRLMGRVMVGSGTASGMGVGGGMDSVGKTGTTSDYRDQWFIGLTPYYSTAVWYGYADNETPLRVNMASNPTILSWRQVMQSGQAGLAYREFPGAANVVEAQYCTVSGHRAGPNCPSATGYYKQGHEPEDGCPYH